MLLLRIAIFRVWRKCCRINDFDEDKVLHVVTLLESILLLFTKRGVSIGAVVRDTSCGSHSIGSLSLLRV